MYEFLASGYDSLTYDVPYEKILRYWQRLCKKYRVEPETVVDLACGMGSLSVLLCGQGYDVIGVDLSEQMLTQAYEKSMQMEKPPLWVRQKMQNLRLPSPVDAVICCLDSINYVTRPADCQKTFHRVFDALKPGGLFVFDVNTPFKLEGLDGQVFLDENEDTYCVWRTEFDRKKKLCRYGMDIFYREGELWQRSAEEHLEYAYDAEELRSYLQQAGFSKIRIFGDRTMQPPKQDALRIFFAAQKERT